MRLHELLSVPSLNLEVIRMYITTYPMNALNQRNDAGDLPLHIALKRPEPESIIICELLNRFPASAREKDSTGNLPLFLSFLHVEIRKQVTELSDYFSAFILKQRK